MNLVALRRDLIVWFQQNARALPWRRQPSPYHTWVSEIMLQQTQVATVIPYFTAFIARFPDVQRLAAAPVDEVLKAWEGLGYYRRARHLHQAAQIIVAAHGGQLPAQEKALLALPGIGPSTAGAIRSIAFGQPAALLDGNVKRVLSRLYDLAENIDRPAGERQLWALAAAWVDPAQPGPSNEALMELGALICTPAAPDCNGCPVQVHCQAYAQHTQYERPVRTPRARIPHRDVVAGVVWHAQQPARFLIAQRPARAMLGGLWEFPGGKTEPGEALSAALQRELAEELGIGVEVGAPLITFDHAYTHFRITLHVFHARHTAGQPQCLDVADWRWVALDELDGFAFSASDRRIIAALAAA